MMAETPNHRQDQEEDEEEEEEEEDFVYAVPTVHLDNHPTVASNGTTPGGGATEGGWGDEDDNEEEEDTNSHNSHNSRDFINQLQRQRQQVLSGERPIPTSSPPNLFSKVLKQRQQQVLKGGGGGRGGGVGVGGGGGGATADTVVVVSTATATTTTSTPPEQGGAVTTTSTTPTTTTTTTTSQIMLQDINQSFDTAEFEADLQAHHHETLDELLATSLEDNDYDDNHDNHHDNQYHNPEMTTPMEEMLDLDALLLDATTTTTNTTSDEDLMDQSLDAYFRNVKNNNNNNNNNIHLVGQVGANTEEEMGDGGLASNKSPSLVAAADDDFGDLGPATTLPPTNVVTTSAPEQHHDAGLEGVGTLSPLVETMEPQNLVTESWGIDVDDRPLDNPTTITLSTTTTTTIIATNPLLEDDHEKDNADLAISMTVATPELPCTVDDNEAAPSIALSVTRAPEHMEDDEFKGFRTVPDCTNTSDPNDQEDEFGDFDEAPSVLSPERHSTTEVDDDNNNNNNNSDDDFGTFDQAPAVLTTIGVGTSEPESDGDFADVGDVETAPEVVVVVVEHTDTDPFGDFGSTSPSGVDKDQTTEDDFGDFGAAPSIALSVTSAPEHMEDDEFKGFGTLPDRTNTSDPNDQEDEFGDFDEAPSVSPSAIEELEIDHHKGITSEFPAAPEFHSNSGSQQELPSGDDKLDDFGDFDEAPAILRQASSEVTQPIMDGNIEEFGDFGGGVQVEQNDENHFGDFGELVSPPELAPDPSDEDDDFGDFGGFGDLEVAESQPQELTPQVPIASVDQTSLKALKVVVSRFQSRYSFATIDTLCERPLTSSCSLASLLPISINEEEKQDDFNARGATSLIEVLLAKQKTSEGAVSNLIINNDGRGPFSQFSFPVGGWPKSFEDVERQGLKRMVVHSAIATEMPPTHLGRKPLSVPSPTSKSSKNESLSRPQAPQFPSLDRFAPSTTSSPAVNDVLNKITDLRFMLMSELTLPG